MAICYVNSGAAGANNGTSKTDAYTTLTAAITGQAAGDTYYVATTHAESTAGAVTLTFKGTLASPDMVLCVDFAGSTPPVAADLSTGASVTTTGANALVVNTVAGGAAWIQGLTFNAGTGASAASLSIGATNAGSMTLVNCALKSLTTATAARINLGNSGLTGNTTLLNTTAEFSNASQGIATQSLLLWDNHPGSATVLGTMPTLLFITPAYQLTLVGLDLDSLGSGKTLISPTNTRPLAARLVNCKINASVTVSSAPTTTNQWWTDLLGCNSTTTAERNERYGYQGTLTTEYTIIRTSGATDGTTAYSWKIVPTANNERNFPFETWEGAIWNTATGSSKTLTVEVLTDNVTLTDAEIWLEVEYLGSSATPVTSFVSDGAATVLTTPANQTTSSVTWTTTGIGTPVKQKLECSFTPQMAGPVRWKVKYAKTSTTVYVDPPQALT